MCQVSNSRVFQVFMTECLYFVVLDKKNLTQFLELASGKHIV